MNKDSFITEIPGIGQAGVVALHKLGINRIVDLLEADYDRVAVVLDDFNEATRLLREARRLIADELAAVAPPPASTPAVPPVRKTVPAPATPTPPPVGLTSVTQNRKLNTRHRAPVRAPAPPRSMDAPAEPARPSQPSMAPAAPPPVPTAPGHLSSHPDPRHQSTMSRTARPDEQAVSNALVHAARGLRLSPDAAADRLMLARRLHTAAALLGQGAPHEDVVAALVLETVEQGTIPAASVSRTFGERAASLVDECGTLRAVPVSPLGKLPKYYLEMASRSSLSARRICAAHQLAQLTFAETPAQGGDESRGVLWYARLLLQALEAGGPDPVILSLRSAIDSAERAAA